MTPNTPMTELPVDDLETAVRAFMPLAQVAFLWTHEASPPEGEIQRYRDAYHNVLRAIRQSDTRIEGGGEPAEWQVEAAARALARSRYLAGHAVEQVNALVDRDWPSYARDARAALRAAAPPVNTSPTPEHVEGDVLSVGEMDDEWLPIDTGPTDGTPVWAISMDAQSPAPRVSWFEPDGRWVRVHTAEKFVASGPCRWWPTHWKPIPAADALTSAVGWQRRAELAEAQLVEARKVLERGREVAPDVMRALLAIGGRDDILLADRVHKSDDAARTFLSTIGEKPDAE